MFRFNHPKEAAKLREKRKVSSLESPGSSSDLGGDWAGGRWAQGFGGEGGSLHSSSSSLTFWSVKHLTSPVA